MGSDAERLARERYLPTERLYDEEVDPRSRADLVVDNTTSMLLGCRPGDRLLGLHREPDLRLAPLHANPVGLEHADLGRGVDDRRRLPKLPGRDGTPRSEVRGPRSRP